MRKAVIDLGTNTFNLIIADVSEQDFETLYTDKVAVAIGLGSINKNQLTIEAQMRALSALKKFKQQCDHFHVESITALGTSAIRDATNSAIFLEKVKQTIHIDVSIISGDKEAELVYYGVLWTHQFQQPTVIMDIGGGSTEFILVDLQGVQNEISLNIGISRVYQEIKTQDPLSQEDIQNIEQWLENIVGNKLDAFKTKNLIGASGVFETFYEMIHLKDFNHKRESYLFDIHDLHQVLDWLIASTACQRDEHPNIIPIRKLMGPITAVKVKWILRKLGIEKVWISPYSMKEGGLRL